MMEPAAGARMAIANDRPTILPWLLHEGGVVESVAVALRGGRIATAGGWWLSIWDFASEANHPLSTTHSVRQKFNVVQWDSLGQQIAVGANDGVVSVFTKLNAPSSQSTSQQLPLEHWSATLRLIGHCSDVVDISWQNTTLLASASLDTTILIWNVTKKEKLLRLDGHRSFVKAVAWDPRGEYLASISDDKRLLLWSFPDGKIAKELTKPFENSPLNASGIMRIDWCPDGSKLVAVGATKSPNAQLCVIIYRQDWRYEYRGINRPGCITIAKFNPFKFTKNKEEFYYWVSAGTAGIISIWKEAAKSINNDENAYKEPIVTCSLDTAIKDITWCPDGYTLLLICSEGELSKWQLSYDTLGQIDSTAEQTLASSFCRPSVVAQPPISFNPTAEPVMQRQQRTSRKRIIPTRVNLREDEAIGLSPSKKRRLRSLSCQFSTPNPDMPIRQAFHVPVQCRRISKYSIEVLNQQRSTEEAGVVVLYSELDKLVWCVLFDVQIVQAVANDTWLYLVTDQSKLMVVHVKSGSVLLSAEVVPEDLVSIACDNTTALAILSSSGDITLFDLSSMPKLHKSAIPLPESIDLTSTILPAHIHFNSHGNLSIRVEDKTWSYDKEREEWTTDYRYMPLPNERENKGPNVSSDVDLNGPERISDDVVRLEVDIREAEAVGDLRHLHRLVMKLVYTLLDLSTDSSAKWITRKLLFVCAHCFSLPALFPAYFCQLMVVELWSFVLKNKPRLDAFQMDLMLLLSGVYI